MTALCEVSLVAGEGLLAQVRLRWLDPGDGQAEELARNVGAASVAQRLNRLLGTSESAEIAELIGLYATRT